MGTPKRTTVYLDPEVHKALRLRAAANDRSISEMVNDAVKAALAEDANDLEAIDRRKSEKSISFESFVGGMKRRGRLSAPHKARCG
jgi:plasmid stability protein